ncbi:MAG: hypothetical protein ACOY31_03455 [Bacillota bacterium]
MKWMEKYLQEPFYVAELVKAGINTEEGADRNLGTIKAMAVFGTIYMALCVFWSFQYLL